ncbi:GntR family transcriptional regulator [Marinobacterium aestuarii]|uniref:GntR family transcriptional regulator n=1 Tax=Marinobacterium aestuarii TaxID=1821621 RepID=A0A1A9ESI2_9GAMM|nr:FadR/GntR family transcriptional regulator [Marinobacterium aestuarii]ANG61134.1 GntR family transcriptional regulator [Marinobacterium aestuarii]
MNTQRIKSPESLSSLVYEKILTAIINGEYSVNKKLPTEAQLCDIYNVSRPVIRESLTRLKEDNLVVSRRGSGSFVIKRPDSTVLQFSRISSISDIQRCFEFRTNIESGAAGLAAVRRTKEQLDRIVRAAQAMTEASKRHAVATDEDFEFHIAIADAANNNYYSTVLKSLQDNIKEGMNITRTLSLQASEKRLTMVQNEHDEILEAIVAGDGPRAETAMRAHLTNAKTRMFEGTGD